MLLKFFPTKLELTFSITLKKDSLAYSLLINVIQCMRLSILNEVIQYT